MSDTTAIRRDNPTPIPTRELEALTDGDRETLAALPEGCALLIVQKGPNSGARYLLNTEKLTIGRNPKNEIFLDDVTVSRVHATLERSGKGFTITDSGILSGSYVNGQRSDSAALVHGDQIQIGKYRLIYISGEGKA
jgi:pSer/pThr/pTyr-binding forkhead associated (FHA) protein